MSRCPETRRSNKRKQRTANQEILVGAVSRGKDDALDAIERLELAGRSRGWSDEEILEEAGAASHLEGALAEIVELRDRDGALGCLDGDGLRRRNRDCE